MQKGLMLIQHKHITDCSRDSAMQHSNHYSRPMEESTLLHSKKDSVVTDMDEYQNPVGSLTKPDQTCHMSVLSQFMTTTLQTHIKAAKKILWYLQGTNHLGIFFPKQNNMQLIAHSDSD
jgi:hypothetical protein